MTTDEISDYLLTVIRRRIDEGELAADVAAQLRVSPATLGNWTGQRGRIPPKEHARIAQLLGLELMVVRPSGADRLSKASARLNAAQVDDLALLAERLASRDLDPTMLEVAVKLLDLRAHNFRTAKAHK